MNSHSFPATGAPALTAREDEAPLTGEAPPARSGSQHQGDTRVRSRLFRFPRVRRAAASLLAVVFVAPLLLAAAPVGETNAAEQPAAGSLRLMGGSSDLEGRVEVFHNGRWGTVCHDLWDDRDAAVACRQLGYHGGTPIVRSPSRFGEGTGPIYLDNVECRGNESRLIDCPRTGLARTIGNHNCIYQEVAGAICSAPGVTASFVGVPAEHDGSSLFTFELRFSENFPGRLSYKLLRDEALQVKNGRVRRVKRVAPRQNQRWTIMVEPTSSEAVTVTLPAATDCAAPGAVCTEGGRVLSDTVSARVPVVTRFVSATVPADGKRVVLTFSKDLTSGGEHSRYIVEVDGAARVTRSAFREDNKVGVILSKPVRAGQTVSVSYSKPGSGAGGLVDADGLPVASFGPAAVENRATGPGPPAPLTASFIGVPAEHDKRAFSFELRFSENFPGNLRYKMLRDEALEVKNGRVRRVKRVAQGENRRWTIMVKPASFEDVVLMLPAGSVRTEAGRLLSNDVSATVQGPAHLTVADAEVDEGPGAAVAFQVTLSRAASSAVTVDYATADGTAVAGEDYTATSGTLTFAAGEVAKTVSVPVLDDAIDEGRETFRFSLSNAAGARVADGEAVGTIVNTDPMPRAWLARFGRTVADQVLDAVGARLEGGGPTRVTLGGREVLLGGPARAEEALAAFRGEPRPAGWRGSLAGRKGDSLAREVSMSELLLASSFHLASAERTDSDPRWSLWGRGARAGFDGREGAFTLTGDVTTGLVGADYESGRALMGVTLALSSGEGSYEQSGMRGDVETSLAGVYPYLRYAVSERLTVWGAAGFGEGDLTLKPAEAAQVETDLTMSMAAAGARGALRAAGGFRLALRSDLVFVRSESDAVAGLAASEADTSRFRLALEASREVRLTAGLLTPSVEFGLRFDGGDAERGAGLELGGALRYASGGFTVDVQARGLATHEENDYEEWGVSASVRYSPDAAGRGLSLRVGSAWGAAAGGMDRLWSQRAAADLARVGGFEPGSSLEAEAGYGFDLRRGLLTPYTGVALTESGEVWRAGARWKLGPAFDLALEGSLTEPAGGDDTESDLLLRGARRW